ncbi:MAG: ABC transporter ATP-binding protein [Chloroflexota bacterium]
MTTQPAPLAVEMRGIVKRFPGLIANNQVDFELRRGEVHALLGENGAGKSTLMNILAGLYQPDAGTIAIDGMPVRFHSPADAIAAGLGMVHQHFTLVPSLTVTENILLGLKEPRFRLALGQWHATIRAFSEKVGLLVQPDAHVWQLSVGEQQRVEILKMLYRGARVLIMDEPTAVLGPRETDELFKTLREMAARGESIVLISHKLDEVLAIADRISVLRKGKVTASGIPATGQTKQDLARLMVGRDVLELIEKTPSTPGKVVLELKDVKATSDRGLPALRGLSLDVRAGEIVGIAGVAGNGQSELAEVITGLRQCHGTIVVNGEDVTNRPVLQLLQAGMAHVPEDRHKTGSAPGLSIADNLIMKSYRSRSLGGRFRLDRRAARRRAQELKTDYAVDAPSIDTAARLLSGGNLQRLILAREITSQPRLIVAVQPTRGLDVGAIETVHRLLLKQRDAGTAILLISEELDELVNLSDRILVIYEGRISGEIEPDVMGEIAEIGMLMTSGQRGDQAPADATVPADAA